MGIKLKSLLVLFLCAGISATAYGGQFVIKTFQAKSYSGSRDRQYQVYIPDSYRQGQSVPLVMILHGCRQTERNMINETRFSELADRENFIVVYPFITSFDGLRNPNCWGFFLDQHIHKGAGEPEDLYQIALEVESEYSIDPNRRYITGLSSGGGMSVVMAVAQSAYFAAAGAAAGLPYSEMSNSVGFVCSNPGTFKSIPAVVAAMQAEQGKPEEARTIPFMTIHSNNDCTVNRQGSVNIRDSWIQRYGASPTAFETTDCTAKGIACTHMKFGAPGRSVVETVFYEGERGNIIGEGSHYWVGDNSGQFASPRGPSATELFWDFFKRHAFSDNKAPTVSISSTSAEGTSVSLAGTAADDDGTVVGVSIALSSREETFQADASLESTPSGAVNWSARLDNLPDNAVYTPVATATDDTGATGSITGDPITIGTPVPPLVEPEVAVANWQGHLSEGRLRVYSAPCPNTGFGACDADFATIFLRFGFNVFSLYKDPAADNWYLDPGTIPNVPALRDQPPVVTITGLEMHDGNCVTITGTATDDSAVTSVAVSLDGGEFAEVPMAGNAWPFNQCGLSEGMHTARIRVRDNASPAQEAMTESSFRIGTTAQEVSVTFANLVSAQGYVKAFCSGAGATVGSLGSLFVGMGFDGKESRTVVSFDTSSIPDAAAIVSAVLKLQHDGSRTGDVYRDKGPITADIKSGCFGNRCEIESGDWSAPTDATAVAVIKNGNGQDNNAWTTNGVLSSTGLGLINKTGETQFRLHIDPSACSGFLSYAGYQVNDPAAVTLEVTYRE